MEPLPDAVAWFCCLGKDVADNLLFAASSHGSVAVLGKNTDEPEKKRAAHIRVPVHSNGGLVTDGGRESQRHTHHSL